MEAGSQNTLYVKIKNISNFVWPVSDRIRLGNHWLDLEGNVLLNDDGRADLPRDLMLGDEVELPLIVNPPRNPGTYIMELDMVKESITWFYDQGSEKAKFNVEVIYSSNIKQLINLKVILPARHIFNKLFCRFSPHETNAVKEIYGVQKSTIIDLINKNGGRLIDIQEDHIGVRLREF